ncbi:MAG: hypothetical protein QOI86_3792 [Actinomycetota bacterium]|nr:hypothetical protein [Actinomycetota bacterium]
MTPNPLTDRWRRLHESLTFAPDHQGVTTPDASRPLRPGGRARLALVGTATPAAAHLLAGGGPTAQPATRAAGTREATTPIGSNGSVPSPAPAASSSDTTALRGNTHGATVATPSSATQGMVDVDQTLASLDTQLTDADRDVATPEGDLR